MTTKPISQMSISELSKAGYVSYCRCCGAAFKTMKPRRVCCENKTVCELRSGEQVT